MDLENIKIELTNDEAILLDVREQKEWNMNHLPFAQLVPLSQLEAGQIPLDLPKNKTIYVHCRIGGRAEEAAKVLKQYYQQVIPIKIPFEELKKVF